MKLQQKNTYSGFLSVHSKKRLARATTLLVQSAKKQYIYNPVSKKYFYHRLSFITLTISDHTKKMDGKSAHKKLLAPFLDWLRRTKKVNTYIWKAEHQANGQIHYHITIPAFIIHTEIRNKWNNLQKSIGLLDNYYANKNHYNANSTDIHSVKHVDNLSAYLIKYICKSYQNENSVGGKVWGCSENLRGAKYFDVIMKHVHEELIQLAVDNNLATEYKAERFTIVKFVEACSEYVLNEAEYKQFQEYLSLIRTYKSNKPELPL